MTSIRQEEWSGVFGFLLLGIQCSDCGRLSTHSGDTINAAYAAEQDNAIFVPGSASNRIRRLANYLRGAAGDIALQEFLVVEERKRVVIGRPEKVVDKVIRSKDLGGHAVHRQNVHAWISSADSNPAAIGRNLRRDGSSAESEVKSNQARLRGTFKV